MMRVLDIIASCRRVATDPGAGADGSGGTSAGKEGEGGAGDGDGDDLPDGFLEVCVMLLLCVAVMYSSPGVVRVCML